MTEPHYIDALRAHFNNVSYRLVEAAREAKSYEIQKDALKARRYQAEQADEPFVEQKELLRVSTLWESAITKADDLGHDLIATFRLIKRCFDLIEEAASKGKSKKQLVAVGSLQDLKLVFENTQSELLQLSGICQDAELYPDENPGEAIFRRGQLFDSALYREGFEPRFMSMSKAEQLRLGNRFMDHLSAQADPDNPERGLRHVVGMIESGRNILIELGLQHEWSALFNKEEPDPKTARVAELAREATPISIKRVTE